MGAEAGRGWGRAGLGEPGAAETRDRRRAGFTCVSHTCAAPRDVLSPPLSPRAPLSVSPQPLPIPLAAGLVCGPPCWTPCLAALGGLARFSFPARGPQPVLRKRKPRPASRKRCAQGWASESGLVAHLAVGALPRRCQTSRSGFGWLVL